MSRILQNKTKPPALRGCLAEPGWRRGGRRGSLSPGPSARSPHVTSMAARSRRFRPPPPLREPGRGSKVALLRRPRPRVSTAAARPRRRFRFRLGRWLPGRAPPRPHRACSRGRGADPWAGPCARRGLWGLRRGSGSSPSLGVRSCTSPVPLTCPSPVPHRSLICPLSCASSVLSLCLTCPSATPSPSPHLSLSPVPQVSPLLPPSLTFSCALLCPSLVPHLSPHTSPHPLSVPPNVLNPELMLRLSLWLQVAEETRVLLLAGVGDHRAGAPFPMWPGRWSSPWTVSSPVPPGGQAGLGPALALPFSGSDFEGD